MSSTRVCRIHHMCRSLAAPSAVGSLRAPWGAKRPPRRRDRTRRGAAVPRPRRDRYVPCVRCRTGIFAPAPAVSLCAARRAAGFGRPAAEAAGSASTTQRGDEEGAGDCSENSGNGKRYLVARCRRLARVRATPGASLALAMLAQSGARSVQRPAARELARALAWRPVLHVLAGWTSWTVLISGSRPTALLA